MEYADTWVKETSKLLQRDFQGLRVELEEDPDGEVLTMDEWKQLCVEMNAASETDTQDGSIEQVAEAQECDGLSEQDVTIHREKWSYK